MIAYFILGIISSMIIFKLFPGPKDSVETFLAIAFFWPIAVALICIIYLSMLSMVFSGRHRTMNGQIVKLKDMTDAHLKNAINYGNDDITNPYWKLQVPRFAKELERRK